MTTLSTLSKPVAPRSHPIDQYFNIFILAKQMEGLQPRTLHDHKSSSVIFNFGWCHTILILSSKTLRLITCVNMSTNDHPLVLKIIRRYVP